MQPNQPATDRIPGSTFALPLALLLLLALALMARWQMQPVAPLADDAPESVFSAGRAYAQLEHLLQEQAPHPVDSPQNRLVEQRIVATLDALQITTEIQQAETCAVFGSDELGVHRCAKVRNIVARIPGSSGHTPILLSAHYDSVPAAPGASDAGAAVASLLEIARLLALQPAPPRNGIVLLFNEGEEFGLLGAKAFMEQHPLAHELSVALNIEARGSAGASILFETGANSGWLVQHYADTTPAPFSSSLFDVMYQWLPNDTDLTLFKTHGLQGLNFAHAERETHYHTPLDNLSTLDQGSLQHHGDNVWGVLERIKDADLNATPPGNLVFTDVLGLFMLSWPEALSPWLTSGLIAVFGLLLWRARASTPGMPKALALIMIVPLSGGLVAWFMLEALKWLSDTPEPWRSDALPMRMALWSAVALVTFPVTRRLTGQSAMMTQMLAQTLFWLLLALPLSLLLPGASVLALLPATLCLMGLLIAHLRWPAAHIFAASIVFPLSGGLFILPLAFDLELLAEFHLAALQGVVLGLTLCTLAPLYAGLERNPRRDKTLYALLTLTLLIGTVWTMRQPAYTAWMPQHLNLRYVQTHDVQARTAQAHVLIDSPHAHVPEALSTALGTIKTGTILPWLESNSRYGVVASAGLAPTELTVLANAATQNGRAVTIKLQTPEQSADMLTLLIPASAGLERIDAHGDKLLYPVNTSTGHHVYQCIGRSCNALELTLHLRSQKPARLIVIQSAHGLPDALQYLDAARGELAVERHNGDRRMVLVAADI